MKKFLAILCLCVLLFTLTACEPQKFHFDNEELKSSIVRVEYIYYDNESAQSLKSMNRNNNIKKLLPFDFDKMEIREVLPEEKLDEFINEVSKLALLMFSTHLDSPKVDSIRIVYNNGDFEILCVRGEGWEIYSGSFYANGEVKRFIGDGISEEFLAKWFNVQE